MYTVRNRSHSSLISLFLFLIFSLFISLPLPLPSLLPPSLLSFFLTPPPPLLTYVLLFLILLLRLISFPLHSLLPPIFPLLPLLILRPLYFFRLFIPPFLLPFVHFLRE